MGTGRIAELWQTYQAPGWDGLYRRDGSAREAEVDGPGLAWLDLGARFDVDALLERDPENVSSVDPDPRTLVELPDGSGYVCGGASDVGSEGFFARLDRHRQLVWLVFLSDSNPFERTTVEGSLATFTNNLGNAITIDLDDPDFAP